MKCLENQPCIRTLMGSAATMWALPAILTVRSARQSRGKGGALLFLPGKEPGALDLKE